MSSLQPSTPTAPTILVVDDDSMIRYNIGGYLEDSGYRIVEAVDGLDALEVIRQDMPALVLCDLRMPGMDGIDLLKQLHQSFPELPAIAVSGTGILRDAVDALRAGAWDFVIKPIEDMAVLEHAVIGSLEKARLIQENRRYQHDLEQANQMLQDSLQHLRDDAAAGRRIQFQIMPDERLHLESYTLSRALLPSMVLSGDFVDYFRVDQNHIGLYLADVSGHGVSSAFITVLLKSHMNRLLERTHKDGDATILEPQRVLSHLNTALLEQHVEKYLTMFYAVIDSENNRLEYGCGGHFPNPILFDGNHAGFLPGRGPPVGLFQSAEFTTETLTLPERFALAAFSDGVLEALTGTTLEDKQALLLDALHSIDIDTEGLMATLELDQERHYPDDITLLLLTRGHRP